MAEPSASPLSCSSPLLRAAPPRPPNLSCAPAYWVLSLVSVPLAAPASMAEAACMSGTRTEEGWALAGKASRGLQGYNS